jgi:hypothetical protein
MKKQFETGDQAKTLFTDSAILTNQEHRIFVEKALLD